MDGSETKRIDWRWVAVLIALLAVRLPSLVQPAGGDQGLYGYAGQRILAGDVMYRDMWDQKPPAIAFVYATLLRIWPSESIVPAADLAAAGAVAFLLILLGSRLYSANAGFGAAAIFLLLGDPYLQRLSGIYVRAQCEPFVALAVTSALVLIACADGRRPHLFAAGIALAVAFWLKYNAVTYGLPAAAAAWALDRRSRSALFTEMLWIGFGFVLVAAVFLIYFAATGALTDFRLATLDYNMRYSGETYEGPLSVLRYVILMPFERARVDMLWFVGGLGALLLAWGARSDKSGPVVFAWLFAAILSIAINGSRSLPNYFVQANPALAFAAGAGFATLPRRGALVRATVGLFLAAALWRVGSDRAVWGLRLASMPGLVENVRYDLAYVRGRLTWDEYLSRFSGQKFDAVEIDRLSRDILASTRASDPIYVFGFSGGSVCWKSERISASRFFWSRPVIVEFAADHPGYGSAGLLLDLQRRPPAIVALQKEEWRSHDFFMSKPSLREWLQAGYRMDRETPMFSVWRRKP